MAMVVSGRANRLARPPLSQVARRVRESPAEADGLLVVAGVGYGHCRCRMTLYSAQESPYNAYRECKISLQVAISGAKHGVWDELLDGGAGSVGAPVLESPGQVPSSPANGFPWTRVSGKGRGDLVRSRPFRVPNGGVAPSSVQGRVGDVHNASTNH